MESEQRKWNAKNMLEILYGIGYRFKVDICHFEW